MAGKGNKAKASEVADKAAIQVSALQEDYLDQLSEWEQGFVTNVYEWVVEKGGTPTENQAATLEKIYRRYY